MKMGYNGATNYIHMYLAAVPKPPKVNITSEKFNRDCVKVVMDWATTDLPISYNINIVTHEQVDTINIYNESDTLVTVELTIPYNRMHNVSIEAVLCNEENRVTSTLRLLNYGEKECDIKLNVNLMQYYNIIIIQLSVGIPSKK